LAVFTFETSAWGLLFKNLFSDAGASAYNMIRYRDPPPWVPFSRGQPVPNDLVAGERQESKELLAEPPLSRSADLGDGAFAEIRRRIVDHIGRLIGPRYWDRSR
jgi:hypothetical protein